MARQTDVVIAGAGMGGLVAATEAADRGADVLVLEKAEKLGGSMALSVGFVWTFRSVEQATERIPDGDSALQKLVGGEIDRGYEWIEDLGVAVSGLLFRVDGAEVEPPIPGIWRQMDPDAYIEATLLRIRENGGEIRYGRPLRELSTGPDGIEGAVIESPDGTIETIPARAVVLATGGFQGNEELVARHVTPNTDRLYLRANPHSTGDGLLAATDVGAKTAGGFDTFYAHNLLAPPAEFGPDEFVEVSQYYGPQAIALDETGRRFTDESESEFEYALAQDTATEAEGRVFLIVDRDRYESRNVLSIGDEITAASERFGGRAAEAADLAALGTLLTEWGADGARAVETLAEFNEHVREGRADDLYPPRQRYREPVDEPPFYAVAVQPGITFTMGGIAVTEDMAVLSRTGSDATLPPYGDSTAADTSTDTRRRTIPGLYAAGVDVGNVSRREYLGGLAQGLMTGIRAGRQAAAYALDAG